MVFVTPINKAIQNNIYMEYKTFKDKSSCNTQNTLKGTRVEMKRFGIVLCVFDNHTCKAALRIGLFKVMTKHVWYNHLGFITLISWNDYLESFLNVFIAYSLLNNYLPS